MNVRELQGNEPLKQQLSTMAEPPHECILSGPEGSGRHALAQILAQALVCQEPQAVHRPCGLCSSCQKVAQGIHPDVVPIQRFLSPESKEIPAGNGSFPLCPLPSDAAEGGGSDRHPMGGSLGRRSLRQP